MPIWSPAFFGSAGATGYVVEDSIWLDGSNDYFKDENTTQGNRRTFTLSMWLKLNEGIDFQVLMGASDTSTYTDAIGIGAHGGGGTDDVLYMYVNNTTLSTSAIFRDLTAWYNVTWQIDTTQSTASNRVKVYVNGVNYALTGTQPSQNFDTNFNRADASGNHSYHFIGSNSGSNGFYANYMSEVIFLDGVADYTQTGEFNSDTGIWVPKECTASYGTNGFKLNFSDASNFGADSSGSGNNLTVNGSMATTQQVIDTCTNDAATQNTLPKMTTNQQRSTNTDGDQDHHTITAGASSDAAIAQSFQVSSTEPIYGIQIRAGTAAANTIGIRIETNNSGAPSGTLVASTAKNDSFALPGTNQVSGLIVLDSPFTPVASTSYWLKVTAVSGASAISIGGNGTGVNQYPDGRSYRYQSSGNSLFNADISLYFEIYQNFTLTGVGNAATWNPLKPTSGTFSNGNLKITPSSDKMGVGTIPFDYNDSDGYYMEFVPSDSGTGYVGIIHVDQASMFSDTYTPGSEYRYQFSNATASDQISDGGGSESNINAGVAWGAGDVVQIAVKGSDIWFGINNTWVNNGSGAGNPSTGANPCFTSMGANSTAAVVPYCQASSSGTQTFTLNNGQSGFTYTPPTNFKALSTQNFTEPSYDPRAYFGIMTWTGNATARDMTDAVSTAGAIEDAGGTAWTPDFVWIKELVEADHALFDITRTSGTRALRTSNATAQDTDATAVTGLISGGVALGNNSGGYNGTNRNGIANVGWFWKAGGSPSSDSGNSASITVNRSTADHQGFSICQGTMVSGTQSFSHGLGAKPEMVIVRDMVDASQHWQTQHKDVNANMANITTLALDRTNDAGSSSNWWGGEPTSTLQYISNNQVTGTNAFVAYLFRRILGLIGIGSYIGNGSADGPYITIDDGGSGFKPAFLLLKEYDGSNNGNWFMRDNIRDPFNPTKHDLYTNQAAAQYTDSNSDIDFTSNGFKIRCDAGGYNQSGAKNLYLAFADTPFVLNNRAR